jgi:hypothetical protein
VRRRMQDRGRVLRIRRSVTYFKVGTAVAAAILVVAASPFASSLAAASAGPGFMGPLSANGCNQNVCIHIVGSGTTVSRWSTTAVLPSKMCSTAEYWDDGYLIYEGTSKCGSAGAKVSSYWSDPGAFPVGTQLCSTWTGVAGKPCETIE